jgi:agmatinase
MKPFDPNAAAKADSGIFGLPYAVEEAKLILIPVPWEVTTSYGTGTANAPRAILNASKQIDLFDRELGSFFEQGIAMCEESIEIIEWNKKARALAEPIIANGGTDTHNPESINTANKVNHYSQRLNQLIYQQTKKFLSEEKIVGVVGGDHSTPFGAIEALLEKHPQMGILHIDAHADLRNTFEGFSDSHASIMYNLISKTHLAKLVQVGIRDYCDEEFHFMKENAEKIISFFDADLVEDKMNGITWAMTCEKIIKNLPQEVYISFDIDGLDPRFCPHTGTPVPGGLDFDQALYLIKKVALSGRKIIGFDLNEVSVGNYTDAEILQDSAKAWDANVAARILYKLCGYALNGKSF